MSSPLPRNNAALEPALEVVRARPLLGTLVQIRASGPPIHIQSAVDAAFAVIERLQRLLSYQDPDSELSALNHQMLFEPRQVHADTYAVLFAALHFARLSDGAFDPCVGFDLEHWGLLPGRASEHPHAGAGRGSWRDIELLADQRVCFHRPAHIDLGGIAKGYAVDLAVQALIDGGARDVVVNAGGDLRVAGPRARPIALRHPLAPSRSGDSVTLLNAALATSGAYFSRQHRPNGDVSALLDPNGRVPHLKAGSVSVRAANCMSADALTKIVLFAPPTVAERALAACDAMAFVQQPHAAVSLGQPRHNPAHIGFVSHAH
jgi:thiamine biosynthesis lipoprotein